MGNVYDPGGNLGTTSTVNVYLNGKKFFHATNSKGKGATHQIWQRFQMTFTAKSNAATLAFMNGDPSTDTDNGLDCIGVVAL